MTTPPEFLKTREWIIIILYFFLMASITLITQVVVPREQPKEDLAHYIRDSKIEVSISGAVKSPGIYRLERGACIKDLLAEAEPLPNANLSKIKLTTLLTQGRHVKIPELETVTLRIEGEVEVPVTMKVAKGTQLKDLLDCVVFTECADRNALQKKRLARDGETITIPKKKGKTREKYCKKT